MPPVIEHAAWYEPLLELYRNFSVDLFWRIALLRDYNTRVVVIGTALLGLAAGVVGTFAYLRRRAMMGDALSHATLPGIALAFLLLGDKSLTWLLAGAAATGTLGVLAVLGLRSFPRIKEDAAIGIVLSVFFGIGMVLLDYVKRMRTGNQAGLDRFIFGKTAGMIYQDALLIAITAIAVIALVLLFYKELRLVCFDPAFAATIGRPVLLVDVIMMGLVVLTTVVGLQAVGLILVVALLIIPAAAARFWTDDLRRMTLIAGLIGVFSGYVGSTFSAMYSQMPAGAMIVICAGLFFFFSMLFAPLRGVLAAMIRRAALGRKIAYQNLLRAMGEHDEETGGERTTVQNLLGRRTWSRSQLSATIARAERAGALAHGPDATLRLTPAGRVEARRILRNHRMWELYLIRHADIAPSHVDRDADQVEHVLSPDIVAELERLLEDQRRIPPSPHAS